MSKKNSCHLNHTNMLDSLTAGCKLLYLTEITVTNLSCYVTYQLLFDTSLHPNDKEHDVQLQTL